MQEGFQGGFRGMKGLGLMEREDVEWPMALPVQGLGTGGGLAEQGNKVRGLG